jgi:hypothetical protein
MTIIFFSPENNNPNFLKKSSENPGSRARSEENMRTGVYSGFCNSKDEQLFYTLINQMKEMFHEQEISRSNPYPISDKSIFCLLVQPKLIDDEKVICMYNCYKKKKNELLGKTNKKSSVSKKKSKEPTQEELDEIVFKNKIKQKIMDQKMKLIELSNKYSELQNLCDDVELGPELINTPIAHVKQNIKNYKNQSRLETETTDEFLDRIIAENVKLESERHELMKELLKQKTSNDDINKMLAETKMQKQEGEIKSTYIDNLRLGFGKRFKKIVEAKKHDKTKKELWKCFEKWKGKYKNINELIDLILNEFYNVSYSYQLVVEQMIVDSRQNNYDENFVLRELDEFDEMND